nr:hypothetical protein [Methylophaga marina]
MLEALLAAAASALSLSLGRRRLFVGPDERGLRGFEAGTLLPSTSGSFSALITLPFTSGSGSGTALPLTSGGGGGAMLPF